MTYEPSIVHSDDPDYAHQLSPLKGGRYNSVFHGPEGTDVGDLHCDLEPMMMGDRPVTVNHSGWQLTDEQLSQLASGAHIRLTVWQHPIPPLAVSVEPPVCKCHEAPMGWDEGRREFRCPIDQLSEAAAQTEDGSAFLRAKETFTPGDPE